MRWRRKMLFTIGVVLLTLVAVIVMADIFAAANEDYIPAGVMTFAIILTSIGMYCILKG